MDQAQRKALRNALQGLDSFLRSHKKDLQDRDQRETVLKQLRIALDDVRLECVEKMGDSPEVLDLILAKASRSVKREWGFLPDGHFAMDVMMSSVGDLADEELALEFQSDANLIEEWGQRYERHQFSVNDPDPNPIPALNPEEVQERNLRSGNLTPAAEKKERARIREARETKPGYQPEMRPAQFSDEEGQSASVSEASKEDRPTMTPTRVEYLVPLRHKAFVECIKRPEPDEWTDRQRGEHRSAIVTGFRQRIEMKTGKSVSHRDIRRVVGYENDRPFNKWRSGDSDAVKPNGKAWERVITALSQPPRTFHKVLAAKKSLQEK